MIICRFSVSKSYPNYKRNYVIHKHIATEYLEYHFKGNSEKSQTKFGRILVITGARQTGKPTLVKSILCDYKYISIEDPITVGRTNR